MPELAIVKANRILSEWTLDDTEITVGRGPDCHIVLDDTSISWHHVKIIKAYGGYLLEDLGSTNGTKINNRRVSKQMLKFGDKIELGNHELRFNKNINDKYSVPTEKTVGMQSLGMDQSSFSQSSPSPSRNSGQKALVRFINGPDAGLSKPIDTSYFTIGKAGVDSAVITRQGEIHSLHYLGGTRVFINGDKLPREGSPLKNNDKIQVGDAEMRFVVK